MICLPGTAREETKGMKKDRGSTATRVVVCLKRLISVIEALEVLTIRLLALAALIYELV